MSGLAMTVEIKGLDTTIASLDKLKLGLRDGMEPALAEIGDLGSKYFGGVAFQSKGSAFGEPWDPLAPSTALEKSKHWPGRPDMVRTSQMRNSFTYEIIDGNAVRLFNSAPWFVYHQSSAERHKLPRRVMIGINDSLRELVRTAVVRQVGTIIDEVTKA